MPTAKTPAAKTPGKQAAVEKLGPDDRVLQKRTSPRNIDIDHANQVPDGNWEVGSAEDQQEALTARKKKKS